jgi:hypothetical protein
VFDGVFILHLYVYKYCIYTVDIYIMFSDDF